MPVITINCNAAPATVHLILQVDECGRQSRRPGSSPPDNLVHPHRNVAVICLRAGSYAAIRMPYLHADGSPRARAGASHPHNFQLSACPRVAEHLWCWWNVGLRTRQRVCGDG
jgi:hypothetical protein